MRSDKSAAKAAGLTLDVFQEPAPAPQLTSTLTLGRVVDILDAASRNGAEFTVTQISDTCLLERVTDSTSGTSLFRISCCSVGELREALEEVSPNS
jgi:hypothetical protein